LHDYYKEINIQVYLTFCKRALIRSFDKELLTNKQFDKNCMYPSNIIAIGSIKRKYVREEIKEPLNLPRSLTFPSSLSTEFRSNNSDLYII
jgi:hypothetical protein